MFYQTVDHQLQGPGPRSINLCYHVLSSDENESLGPGAYFTKLWNHVLLGRGHFLLGHGSLETGPRSIGTIF